MSAATTRRHAEGVRPSDQPSRARGQVLHDPTPVGSPKSQTQKGDGGGPAREDSGGE